jgi:hypothetical protein
MTQWDDQCKRKLRVLTRSGDWSLIRYDLVGVVQIKASWRLNAFQPSNRPSQVKCRSGSPAYDSMRARSASSRLERDTRARCQQRDQS